MLLAVDIGNTNIVLGVFDKDSLISDARLSTSTALTIDEACVKTDNVLRWRNIDTRAVDRVVIGSVVPRLTGPFAEMSRRLFSQEPLIVSHRISLPIRVDIDQPEQVGADRIANAAAGFEKYGGPVIVVDFGTATTFDIVSGDGAYIGGVIIPGPENSLAELARRAARLFEVRIEKPQRVVGKSTSEALKSGLFYGTVGQVDFLVDRIIEDTGFTNTRVIGTGGLVRAIEPHSRRIETVDLDLTLDGLRLIAAANPA